MPRWSCHWNPLPATHFPRTVAAISQHIQKIEDYDVEHEFPKLGRRTILLNGRRAEERDGKEPLFLVAIDDVTERK